MLLTTLFIAVMISYCEGIDENAYSGDNVEINASHSKVTYSGDSVAMDGHFDVTYSGDSSTEMNVFHANVTKLPVDEDIHTSEDEEEEHEVHEDDYDDGEYDEEEDEEEEGGEDYEYEYEYSYDDDDDKKRFKNHGAMTKKEKATCLEAHNMLRRLHKSKDLKWDENLEKHAQSWADSILLTNALVNDPKLNQTGEGENIFTYYGPTPMKCAHAVRKWYEEVNDYDYNTGKAKKRSPLGRKKKLAKRHKVDKDISHFAQIVYADTNKVGVGLSSQFAGQINGVNYFRTSIVARYSAPANKKDQYKMKISKRTIDDTPTLDELDESICTNALTTKFCNVYEKKYKIGCNSNSWKEFMYDSCYKKCTDC